MIRIGQLKIPADMPEARIREELEARAARTLRIPAEKIHLHRILRRSLDARRKPELYSVYTIAVKTELSPREEERALRRARSRDAAIWHETRYHFPVKGTQPCEARPVVVGAGPAGLFCALLLAENGYRPLLVERGRRVEERAEDIERFWRTGRLDPASNVQFGEGGAGAFSDGKLNSGIGDRSGRSAAVLETFVEAGAPQDILYESRPHVGTDLLRKILPVIRERIEKAGGEIRFGTLCEGLDVEDGAVRGIRLRDAEGAYALETGIVVLAPGHSARDTFRWLADAGIAMQQKAFAAGLRVSHPQRMIDAAQYGPQSEDTYARLPAATYKLTAKTAGGRGVYSFCMCPGGYIVNASSEEGGTVVNGMSDHARDSGRANSAIVVTVSPEDFGSEDPLAGAALQRELEERAYARGAGAVPVQSFADYERGAVGTTASRGAEDLCIRGQIRDADLRGVLPAQVEEAFLEGMHVFDRQIPGFAGPEAVLAGVETRTSSPVRIVRDESLQASLRGLFPCGEGAGYAGGILSAAVDGIRTAEAVAAIYRPMEERQK